MTDYVPLPKTKEEFIEALANYADWLHNNYYTPIGDDFYWKKLGVANSYTSSEKLAKKFVEGEEERIDEYDN